MLSNRRMMSRSIIESIKFTELSKMAQLLYFHLLLNTDDYGFVPNPNRILKQLDFDHSEIEELAKSGLLIMFSTGICVITDFYIQNTIRKDREKELLFLDERNLLELNKNKSYRLKPSVTFISGKAIVPQVIKNQSGTMESENNIEGSHRIGEFVSLQSDSCQTVDSQLTDNCQSDVNQLTAQYKLSKDNLMKQKEDVIINNSSKPNESDKEKNSYGEFKNVHLTPDEFRSIVDAGHEKMIDDISRYISSKGLETKYKNHYATIKSWIDRKERSNQNDESSSNRRRNRKFDVKSTVEI
jgi:hypothetical protein